MILPVALIKPAVTMFPPITFPTAETNPAVLRLLPVTLAEDVIVPMAVINPAVVIFPPITLPLAVTTVAITFPPLTLAIVVILPVADITPATFTLPPLAVEIFPPTVSALATESNTNPLSAPATPLLLNSTCVLEPGTVIDPTRLPIM